MTGLRALGALLAPATIALLLYAFCMQRSEAQALGGAQPTSGEEVYHQICRGCHMPNGKGALGAGSFPALAGDPALASMRFMAITLLEGRRNMPSFGGVPSDNLLLWKPTLTDEQIAAVINYVRSHFGNRFKGTITAADVKALRHP
jgi:mono/diheme cytochrome c family protein